MLLGSIRIFQTSILGFAWCFAALWLAGAGAQEPPGTKASPPERISDVLPPGLRPDVVYLRNEKGEDILIPRTSYEEYERLLVEGASDGRDPLAPIGLSSLDMAIEPEKDYANIALKATANVGKHNKSGHTIPIALGQLQWVPRPSEPSEGSTANSFDGLESVSVASQSNGYLWRVSPGSGGLRGLQLNALSKLTSSSGGYAIRLDLPPAATVIRLKLPLGEWELSATGGGNEVIEPFRTVDAHSVAIVRTTASTVTLSWNRKTEKETLAAIEVTSQTKFSPSVDGTLLRAVTNLAIRGPRKLGGKRFLITLPPGSVVRDTSAPSIGFPAYRLQRTNQESELDSNPSIANPPVELSLELEEALSRSEIEIPIEWQWSSANASEGLQFVVPTINGVQRHTGTFECSVPRNVLFDWEPLVGARLLRQSAATDGSDSMVYAFQFDRQGAGVACNWTSLASRPNIHSKLSVEVKEKQLQMTGSLEFLSDPFQLPLLQFEVQGWHVIRLVMRPSDIEIEPSAIGSSGDATGPASIPIHSNLWMSPPNERPATSSEAARTDLTFPGVIPTPISTTTSGASAAKATTDGEKETRIRLEFVLTKSIDPSNHEFDFSLPQLSWLSQDSQQRISKTLPGVLTLSSWSYRLEETSDGSQGWVHIPNIDSADRTDSTNAFEGFTPFQWTYQIAEATPVSKWIGTRHRRPSSTAINYEADVSVNRTSFSIQHRWNCVSYGNRPTVLRMGLPKSFLDSAASVTAEGPAPIHPPISSFKIDGKTIDIEQDGPATDDDSRQAMRGPEETDSGWPNEIVWIRIPIPSVAADGSNRNRFIMECTTHSTIIWDDRNQSLIDQALPVLESDQPEDGLVSDSAVLKISKAQGVIVESTGDTEVVPSTGLPSDTTSTSDRSIASMLISLNADLPRWTARVFQASESLRRPIQVEAEWVQSILNAIYQRDRYVVRFVTDADSIEIEIPAALRKDAEWILDGQRASVIELQDSSDKMRVLLGDSKSSLRNAAGDRIHVLEVFTLKPAQGGLLKKIGLSTPRLQSPASTAPLVWQIVVPRTEHLIYSSDQLSPLYRWKWKDIFFARSSEYSQSHMETTMGATQQAVVAQQTNQYDLSSMTGSRSLEAWFVPSSLIWLPTSLVFLILSAMMTEKRWLRWPWVWVLFLASVLVFSQWAWDISVIVAQASMVAISVAVLYGLLRWLLDRRARRRSIFVSRSASVAAGNASRASVGSGSNLSPGDGNSRSNPPGLVPATPSGDGA
ncbi:MAG: hypothetical protein WCI02_09535 [Planctomycetota bacterium]